MKNQEKPIRRYTTCIRKTRTSKWRKV